ncbi:hypothetical protein [Acinetobacter gerneri]|uniref:hypothetical protein n=1 Tax=Acinetobacter gerneri TaxID=202952 RepID=UPI0028A86316|nr:hypothetical protein [Acinetobacter gerneri]
MTEIIPILWCVSIAEDPYSNFEQTPAVSKEIAERAVARMHQDIDRSIEDIDLRNDCKDCVQAEIWKGSAEDHKKDIVYDEDWFTEPFYRARDEIGAEKIFAKFPNEIIECVVGQYTFVTTKLSDALRFFGNVKSLGEVV